MTQEELKTHHDNCEAAKDNLTLKGFTGPWNNELNRLNWKAHGLDCMLVRNPVMLNWCGYVGISSDHPDFNRDYIEYRLMKYSPETYKTEQYAKLETQNLALQLSKRRK